MTLREMEIFAEAARTGSMSAAARNLYVSQSTVSQSILSIERHYGVQLFQRQVRRLVLTPEGERALRYCTRILSLHQRMEYELKYSGERSIRVGVTLITAQSLFRRVWREYHLKCPDVTTRITVDTGELLVLKLQNYELDTAILDQRPDSPELVSQIVGEDEFRLICPTGSAFARRSSVTLAELADQPLLMQQKGSPTRDLLDRAAEEQGLRLSISEFGNIDVIRERVAAGGGLSVMARRLAESDEAAAPIAAVPIADLPQKRYFYEVHHRSLQPSGYLEDFLRICRKNG